MGHELYREFRDYAPADLSQGELCVAWIIADDANERTRRSWIANELLCHYARMTPTGVRAALQRLAGRGLEFRVAKGTDKHGRPVYAAKGNSVDYLVPTVAQMLAIGDTTASPLPVDNHPQSRHAGVAYLVARPAKGDTVVLKGDTRIAKGDTVVSPLSSDLLNISSITNGPDLTGPVESSGDPPDQDHDLAPPSGGRRQHMTKLEEAAWAAIGNAQ